MSYMVQYEYGGTGLVIVFFVFDDEIYCFVSGLMG